jgi:hypothetical protein
MPNRGFTCSFKFHNLRLFLRQIASVWRKGGPGARFGETGGREAFADENH